MLNSSTYSLTNPEAVKQAASTTYEWLNDTDYPAFVQAVYSVLDDDPPEGEPEILPSHKLEKVWFRVPSFRRHWLEPSKGGNNGLVWDATQCGFTQLECQIVVFAWMHFHGRNVSESEWSKYRDEQLAPAWKTARKRYQTTLERRAHKARMKRRQANMNKKDLRKTDTRQRILDAMKAHPTTTDVLAKELGIKADAIESQLRRLLKDDLVWRMGHGLYALVAKAA